ncbi:methyltransferase domain-containing protein [Nocardiopsis sp. CNT-189]|uniref:class I SAM-dependent methyltransferase n=1 Tax=Nocardiopsis oceanisediminis TaxID=2816862 RepID=UPI003B36E57D
MGERTWNAELYDTGHSYVAAYGDALLELLAARPGERVLDAGCGTGEHAARLREAGAEVVGVDASPEMIDRARARFPGLDLRVADLRSLGSGGLGGFDAVLSNAVLHWIPEADRAAASLAAVLRPGGRLVAEFGGAGNIATIDAGARAVRTEHGLPDVPSPWYYPGPQEYTEVLERAGFEVAEARLFDRPTRLEGEDGLARWLRMFAAHLSGGAGDEEAFRAAVADRVRADLYRDGAWWADYRRLRVTAVRR